MRTLLPVLAATAASGSIGLGIIIICVSALMAMGAGLTLRSIWSKARAPEEPLARQGPLPADGSRLRSPQVGQLRGWFRLMLSFDFGCLAIMAALLLFIGLAVIFRALGS